MPRNDWMDEGMNIHSFPQENENQALASLFKPIPQGMGPDDEFVYWTRRMLLNVIGLPSLEEIDLAEADVSRDSQEAA